MGDLAEGFERAAEELVEKLGFLRQAAAIEAQVTVKFQLTKQIEEAERELDEILNASRAQKVYRALLRLDYRKQEIQFEKTVGKARSALFVIRGKKDHGHEWLLHRLLRQYDGKICLLDADGSTTDTSVAGLWNQLASYANRLPDVPRPEIAGKLCQVWKTQHVAIIVKGIGATTPQYVSSVIKDLWHELLKCAMAMNPAPARKLLMFLIDCEGKEIDWQLHGVDKYDDTWSPHVPLRLEEIAPFELKLVQDWIEGSNELPVDMREEAEQSADRILKASLGVPIKVLSSVCTLCETDWEYYRSKWTKYR